MPSDLKFNRREFQEALHSALGPRTLEFMADYVEYLELEGTPDQKMKFIEWSVRTLGGEAEKQQSQNQYATVTVNIGLNGTVTVGTKPAEIVEEVPAPLPLVPSSAMVLSAVNADLAGLDDAC